MNPGDATEDDTLNQDAAAAADVHIEVRVATESPSDPPSPVKPDGAAPPDLIPESDKMRSSPEIVANSSVTTVSETTTHNHVPGNTETTVVTREEVVHTENGTEVHESVVITETRTETTHHEFTSKTVETVVVNSDEVCINCLKVRSI